MTEGHLFLPQYSIDRMKTAGLPLWATELTAHDHDQTVKANTYEDMLWMLFGTPEVEGIALFAPWDHGIQRPDGALWVGPNLEVSVI